MGKGQDSWPNKPPHSNYPAGGVLFEGLGVIVKSDHHKTGKGSVLARGHKSPGRLWALDSPLAALSAAGTPRKVFGFLGLSEETQSSLQTNSNRLWLGNTSRCSGAVRVSLETPGTRHTSVSESLWPPQRTARFTQGSC